MDNEVALRLVEELAELRARVEVLEGRGALDATSRNRSSALKREMNQDDARRVLNGDLRDMNHKDAAEVLGLTYAQIYACRLAYTFKNVHKDLKAEGWLSPWAKK